MLFYNRTSKGDNYIRNGTQRPMSMLRHVPGKSRGGRQVKKKRTCREEDGEVHKEVRGMIRLQALWINERGEVCGEIWKVLSGIGGG